MNLAYGQVCDMGVTLFIHFLKSILVTARFRVAYGRQTEGDRKSWIWEPDKGTTSLLRNLGQIISLFKVTDFLLLIGRMG